MDKTIAAISTAQAPGGIGIVRISGPDAKKIASAIFRPKGKKIIQEAAGYTALYGHAVTAKDEVIDVCLALIFTAPKSYTGEDVVEISCHGGLFVMERILREVFRAGAAPAQPGEFTKRAFLNGKLDLTEAEAVMELIGAKSADAAKMAVAGNEGLLSQKMNKLKKNLIDAAAHLSAWADYPEDEIPEITEIELNETLSNSLCDVNKMISEFDVGKLLREGVRTVIVGKPNVGKSTIMNLLSGYERSIVTEYAGTTRDIVEEVIILGGIPLYIADTAGIHETFDPVEKIGVDKAKKELCQAQLILAVFDASISLSKEDRDIIKEIRDVPAIALVNKTDLGTVLDEKELKRSFRQVVYLSAKDGKGIDELQKTLRSVLKAENIDLADGILYTERQRDVMNRLKFALEDAREALCVGMTFDAVTVAIEECISILMEMTGERVSESVINEVFSKFCVGK